MLGTSPGKKKKKLANYEEEEKLKALLKKPVDVTTLNNDKLRPWTVNPTTEEILSREIGKLDKTIIITSPQMSAGDIGFSVLDRKPKEIDAFQESLKTRAKLNPYRTYYDNYILANTQKPTLRNSGSKRGGSGTMKNNENFTSNNVLIDNGHRSNNNSRTKQGISDESFSDTRNDVNEAFNSSTQYHRDSYKDEITSEVDEEYVSRIQKMIQAKSNSYQHHKNVPFPTVQYKPFKSPAVFPVSTTEYQKMRNEIKSFPKPSCHLNHRNQLLMVSLVNNHQNHTKSNQTLLSSRELKDLKPIKSLPDIKSSYYHFPPPSSD